MAENPFARFVEPSGQNEQNPFSRFVGEEAQSAPASRAQPEQQPAGGPSPRARRAVEDAKSFTESFTRRPTEGGIMGFFAPEAAGMLGRGMQLVPFAPVKAAGKILTEAAPRIPRSSSAALGATAGAAGAAAEQGALRAGASPEVAGLAGTTGELVTGIGLPSLISRLPRATGAVTRAEEAAKRSVSEAEARAARLEREASGRITETVEQTQAQAAAAQKRLGEIDSALQQIAERDAVAQARAQNRALDPTEVQELRRRVTRRLQDDVAAAEAEARAAGKNVESAKAEALDRIAAAEDRKLRISNEIERLQNEFLSRPGQDAADFGDRLRRTVRDLNEKFEQARERSAGFGKAIASAGADPIVPTTQIEAYIDQTLRQTRDPSIAASLRAIRQQLTTMEEGAEEPMRALSVEAADSLRKYLNRILSTKRITFENGQEGDAAAAIHHISKITDMVKDAATKAHRPYGEALETFARLSSPADFRQMQVGGALRRLFSRDVRTQNELMSAADVVGEMLRKARGGYPVFEALIARDPELVNAARMYFNRELFGAGRVPSVDQLGAFLRLNERPLRSFGLYNEFSNIMSARRTAQTAMENAETAVREARASVRGIEAAQMRAAPSRSLISAAKSRQQAAVSGLETAEDIARASSQRAREAETRLTKERQRIAQEPETARKLQNDLRTAQIDIERAAPGETVAAVRPAIDRLRRAQLVSDADYGRLVTEMQAVDDAFKSSAKAAKDAEDARKAAQAVMQRWRDRVFGATGAAAGFAGAGLLGIGPARFRRMFKE